MKKITTVIQRLVMLALLALATHYTWATLYFETVSPADCNDGDGFVGEAVGDYNGTSYGRTVANYNGSGRFLWEQACGFYPDGSGDHWYHDTIGPIGSIALVRSFNPATFQSGLSYIYDVNSTSHYSAGTVSNLSAP